MQVPIGQDNVFVLWFWRGYVCPINRDTQFFQDSVRLSRSNPATAGQEKGHDGNRSLFSPTLDRVIVLDDAPPAQALLFDKFKDFRQEGKIFGGFSSGIGAPCRQHGTGASTQEFLLVAGPDDLHVRVLTLVDRRPGRDFGTRPGDLPTSIRILNLFYFQARPDKCGAGALLHHPVSVD